MNTRRHAKANLWNADHGAGKGDKDRTDSKRYAAGMAQIKLDGNVEGLERIGPGRHRKTYGPKVPVTIFEATQGKIIIH